MLELSADERRVLESAALLHDIGLVGVPRQIIRHWQDEPESLSPAEKALIEQHPILGQELAGFTSELVKVGEVIRAHHERFDGKGYPDQLVGENIPWLARLLSVAVAYASSPLAHQDAVEKIKMGADTLFDPGSRARFSEGADRHVRSAQGTRNRPARIAPGHGARPGNLHHQRPLARPRRPAAERHFHRKTSKP